MRVVVRYTKEAGMVRRFREYENDLCPGLFGRINLVLLRPFMGFFNEAWTAMSRCLLPHLVQRLEAPSVFSTMWTCCDKEPHFHSVIYINNVTSQLPTGAA